MRLVSFRYSRIIDHLRPQSVGVLSQQQLKSFLFPKHRRHIRRTKGIRSVRDRRDPSKDAAIRGADPIDPRSGYVRLLDYCQEHGVGTLGVRSRERLATLDMLKPIVNRPARDHAGGIVAAVPAILSRSCAHRMWRPHIAQNTHWRRSGIDRRTTRHARYTQSQRPTSGLRD